MSSPFGFYFMTSKKIPFKLLTQSWYIPPGSSIDISSCPGFPPQHFAWVPRAPGMDVRCGSETHLGGSWQLARILLTAYAVFMWMENSVTHHLVLPFLIRNSFWDLLNNKRIESAYFFIIMVIFSTFALKILWRLQFSCLFSRNNNRVVLHGCFEQIKWNNVYKVLSIVAAM